MYTLIYTSIDRYTDKLNLLPNIILDIMVNIIILLLLNINKS